MPANNPRRPKFLYFDMGNVLLLFDHEIACRQIAELTGLTVDRVRDIIFTSGLEWRYERGDLSSAEFYDEFCAQSGTTPPYDQFAEAASTIFTLHEPVAQLVQRLSAGGWPMGVLSNTCEAHWRQVYPHNYVDLWKAFQYFALSYEINSMKPEPQIYTTAAQMVNMPLEEIFFVDDRPENVEQARAQGIDAVLFTTPAQLEADLQLRGIL